MKNIFTIPLLLILFLMSCEKEYDSPYHLGLKELEFTAVDIDCYANFDGTVIDSNDEYIDFQNNPPNEFRCDEVDYPAVDFEVNTLVGITRSDSGCGLSQDIYSNVYIDRRQKKYVFQAIAPAEGLCHAIIDKVFWVTIPKLPEDYTVEFVAYDY